MKQHQANTSIQKRIILLLSILGLIACIAVLFPQVRIMIIHLAEKVLRREILGYEGWIATFLSFAMGGILIILFFDYCTLTHSGKILVKKTKQEIMDCMSEIDFRSLWKPVLFMSAIYLLGFFAILRANYSFVDDLDRAVNGTRGWDNWSRYVSEFLSIFIHADTNLTDISPLPQLLAVLFLSMSSVLLIYIVDNKKLTVVRLLASIPLGLSPFFLTAISFKFDAPYMALSILVCIVPFLFITRKRAFIFCSFVSLLIMCMTYQVSSGIFMLITIIICFQDWKSRKRTDKDILSFLGVSALVFCFALVFFKFCLVKSSELEENYVSTAIHPLPQMLPGILNNLKGYITNIWANLAVTWRICILLILTLFITKSIHDTSRKKMISFLVSLLVIGLSFISSYGIYILLNKPYFHPRALYGFGVFLAISGVYVVSDYKKIAAIPVLALSWSFLTFASSFGNALADQARYDEFRTVSILRDLSSLYPDRILGLHIENSVDFVPSIENISKHYPIIKKLVPKRLHESIYYWGQVYITKHFNYYSNQADISEPPSHDWPVVIDSYYHTIKSDGNCCLIILKH